MRTCNRSEADQSGKGAHLSGPKSSRSREKIVLRTPGRFIYIKPVRSFVTVAAHLAGFAEEKIEEIGLLVTEIFNNAVEYGSADPSNQITITLELHHDRMILSVRDEGRNTVDFDTLLKRADQPKPVDDLEQRGRGLFLIKRLTEELTIRHTPGKGTEVTVTKLK